MREHVRASRQALLAGLQSTLWPSSAWATKKSGIGRWRAPYAADTPASYRRRAGAATRLLLAVRAYTATQDTTASVRDEAVSLRFDVMEDAQRPTHYFYEIYQHLLRHGGQP